MPRAALPWAATSDMGTTALLRYESVRPGGGRGCCGIKRMTLPWSRVLLPWRPASRPVWPGRVRLPRRGFDRPAGNPSRHSRCALGGRCGEPSFSTTVSSSSRLPDGSSARLRRPEGTGVAPSARRRGLATPAGSSSRVSSAAPRPRPVRRPREGRDSFRSRCGGSRGRARRASPPRRPRSTRYGSQAISHGTRNRDRGPPVSSHGLRAVLPVPTKNRSTHAALCGSSGGQSRPRTQDCFTSGKLDSPPCRSRSWGEVWVLKNLGPRRRNLPLFSRIWTEMHEEESIRLGAKQSWVRRRDHQPGEPWGTAWELLSLCDTRRTTRRP